MASVASVVAKNNVRVSGAGSRPILFAHGFGCDQHMWRFMTPAFAEGYRTILFDHVGAGRSDLGQYDRSRYGSLRGYAMDLLDICRALELEDVILVGHSVSAMIGLLAAIEAPERFARLVMVGPSPRYLDDEGYVGGFSRADIDGLLDTLDSNYLGWAASMAPVIMANQDRPELGQELATSFCTTDPTIAKHFARVTFLSDNRQDLPRTTVPTLILQCSEDVIAPVEVGRYMHEQMRSSELAVMKATGHCPHVSAPDETIALIRSFV